MSTWRYAVFTIYRRYIFYKYNFFLSLIWYFNVVTHIQKYRCPILSTTKCNHKYTHDKFRVHFCKLNSLPMSKFKRNHFNNIQFYIQLHTVQPNGY